MSLITLPPEPEPWCWIEPATKTRPVRWALRSPLSSGNVMRFDSFNDVLAQAVRWLAEEERITDMLQEMAASAVRQDYSVFADYARDARSLINQPLEPMRPVIPMPRSWTRSRPGMKI